MSSIDDHDHDHEETIPITEEIHDNSWSVNLEKSRYADDPDLVIRPSIYAIEQTSPGNHVNLVTHADLDHPEEFLF